MHGNSGIAYEDMIFFDDEQRNIIEVGKMGKNPAVVLTLIQPSWLSGHEKPCFFLVFFVVVCFTFPDSNCVNVVNLREWPNAGLKKYI